MPFGPLFSPSLGLSLLQAQLTRQGWAAEVGYPSLRFAERIGQAFYSQIAMDGSPSIRELVGEWIFSGTLFGAAAGGEEDYVEQVLRRRSAWPASEAQPPVSEAFIRKVRAARAQADEFLAECVGDIVRRRPRVLGLTSVFQQHVASLALARRVKQALPGTFVVLGGANCEGIMGAETVRQFPFVDAAVSGEADLLVAELVRRVFAGEPIGQLPGVRTADAVVADLARVPLSNAPMVQDMDALPAPDFGDFFTQFQSSRFARHWRPSLFFESSRGCWWGERRHCTFCGLNGASMVFRSKSATRVLLELEELAAAHPGCDVQVVDNILDMAYFHDLLPELARRKLKIELFYETKANLRKEQVRQLRDARILRIQPGIESLSDSVLSLMRKGVTGLQNIQLLKWCKELGVAPFWNLLWGFPGEDPAEYGRMAELVPLISHLPPPVGAATLRLDRFSPNFVDAERLGLAEVKPLAPYRHVYPLPQEALANLAYYFAFRYRQPQDVAGYVRPLQREVQRWRRRAGRSDLFSVDVDERLFLFDLRPGALEWITVLVGDDRTLYQACDAARDLRSLAEGGGGQPDRARTERQLDRLVARRLMLRQGGRFLALAVSLGEYEPSAAVVARFEATARSHGRATRTGIVVPFEQAPRPGRTTDRRVLRRLTPRQFEVLHGSELLIRRRA